MKKIKLDRKNETITGVDWNTLHYIPKTIQFDGDYTIDELKAIIIILEKEFEV